jgi:hypothetical protein
MGPVNLRIQKTKRSAPFIVHVDKVKKYYGDMRSMDGEEITEIPEQPATSLTKQQIIEAFSSTTYRKEIHNDLQETADETEGNNSLEHSESEDENRILQGSQEIEGINHEADTEGEIEFRRSKRAVRRPERLIEIY